ncbi:MAG: hypothetical protein ACREJ9_08725 [Candidatus Rokuibacteriota bacterium]
MRRDAAVIALMVAFAASSMPAGAALLTLGEPERQEALRTGERSVSSEVFGEEWRIVHGSGESVTVFTPFHRLALAARHAAFKKEPLKPQDQARLLEELKDRLVFWVDLHGPREDFARHLRPRLVAGTREIEPSLVQNDRTALRRENGSYLARCQYAFPTKDLSGTARVTLVVRDAEGQAVARFPIDLSRMR